MKAMILAAGLGTRLKPFTDEHPKALAPVNGRSVLQRNVEYLQAYGISDVIVNVHHFADQIRLAVAKASGWGSRITLSDETDAVLETGGGIAKAGWFLRDSDPFVVMNADVLTDLDLGAMIDFHRKHKPLATLATTNRVSSRSLLFDDAGRLCGWKHGGTGELRGSEGHPKAFSGIQVLSPAILDMMPRSGRFSMIDVYLSLCPQNSILSFDHSGSLFMDIGTQEKLEKAAALFP